MLLDAVAIFAGSVAPATAPVGNCPAGTSHDIITTTEDIKLARALPPINSEIKTEGYGYTISTAITHPHPVCLQANALLATAIAHAIRAGCTACDLYKRVLACAMDMEVEESLLAAVEGAAEAPPADYVHLQGWALVAFRNALWQVLHASNPEDAIIDTVMRGGDTDTNAAIAGALVGAIHGRNAIPERWVKCILNCRPEAGLPHVRRPRPRCFWPLDALELAGQLIGIDWVEDGSICCHHVWNCMLDSDRYISSPCNAIRPIQQRCRSRKSTSGKDTPTRLA